MLEELDSIHPLLPPVAGILALLAGAFVINLVAKRLLVGAVRALAKRSSVTWDDALVEHNVFGRLVQVVPALVVFVGVTFVPGLPEVAVQLMRNVAMGYMVLMLTLALTAMLSAAAARADRDLDFWRRHDHCGSAGSFTAIAAQWFRCDDRYPFAGIQGHDIVTGCERATHRAGHGSRW
jgi:hypothetical protein